MKNRSRIVALLCGVVFLFLATGLFLANLLKPVDLAPINDPIFSFPLPTLYGWIGLGAAVIGLVCLFTRKPMLPLTLVAVFTALLLGCRWYASLAGLSAGFGGYLGGLGGVFGGSGGTMDAAVMTLSLCLLAGSIVVARLERKPENPAPEEQL